MNKQSSKPKQLFLNLTVTTWEKDSHGLFDYEAVKHSNKKFKIEGPCKIFRNWLTSQTVLISNEDAKKGKLPSDYYNFLASVNIKRNGNNQTFMLNAPERPTMPILRTNDNMLPPDEQGPINTNSYLVAKYCKSEDGKIKGHALAPGNIIKLGRVEFLVIECKTLDKTYTIRNTSHINQKNGVYTVGEELIGTCKFCLSDEITKENFLMSPCNCKGSCQSVHINCLKMWIDSKIKKQPNGIATTYNFTKFECELCKQPFPKLVVNKNRQIDMITIEKPDKPYIIFQSLNDRNETKEQKNLHLITADEKIPIRLGRGHQCEIRMTDISVSRLHAEIKFQNNNFYIVDNNSKFGTLINLDKKLEISEQIMMQCGRSTYSFQLDQETYPKTAQLI